MRCTCSIHLSRYTCAALVQTERRTWHLKARAKVPTAISNMRFHSIVVCGVCTYTGTSFVLLYTALPWLYLPLCAGHFYCLFVVPSYRLADTCGQWLFCTKGFVVFARTHAVYILGYTPGCTDRTNHFKLISYNMRSFLPIHWDCTTFIIYTMVIMMIIPITTIIIMFIDYFHTCNYIENGDDTSVST